MTEPDRDLEVLVEAKGMGEMLMELAAVCYGKSDQIIRQRFDKIEANRWQRVGHMLTELATRETVQEIS